MATSTLISTTGIKRVISTDGTVRFVGKWVVFTKIGWAISALIVSLTVIIGLPYGYRILSQTCADKCFINGQLTQSNVQDLQKLGLSLETYALVYCSILVLFALICLGASWLVVWKKPGELMPYCAARFMLGLIMVESSFVFFSPLFRDYPALNLSLNLLRLIDITPYLFLAFPGGRFKSKTFMYLCLSMITFSFCTNLNSMVWQVEGGNLTTSTSFLLAFVIVLLVVGTGFFFEKASPEGKLKKFWPYLLVCLIGIALYIWFWATLFAIALIYRYFKLLTPRERQATRWFLYAFLIWFGLLMSALALLQTFPSFTAPGSYYFLFLGFIGFFGCGINLTGLLLAILYGNAFDIDLIINRTLVFSLLTGCVVGLYTLIVLGARQLFGFGETNLVVSLVATGLIAVLFQPLRTGLQRTINRLLFGRRNEPYAVLATLGQRLETTIYQPEAVLPELVNSIATSLKLPFVAIKLAGQERLVSEASLPTNLSKLSSLTSSPVNFALSYQGETVGDLLVSPRRGEERLAERDLRLLKDLARQIGVVVYSLKLLADLREANTELKTTNLDLRRAREKLVLAREEERRKLRRDLHDDLAPSLAGLALSADALTGLIEQDLARARLKSQELYTAIRHSVGDVRRLAHELRPPTLDEFGLVAALQERSQQFSTGNLLVKLEASPDLPLLPAAVEVATYRVAQEALMNVVRHAVARHCLIRLVYSSQENKLASKNEATLTLEISDDGQGLPAHRSSLTGGVGLRSMREQAEELGGTFTIENQPGGGTLACLVLSFEGNNSSEPASLANSR